MGINSSLMTAVKNENADEVNACLSQREMHSQQELNKALREAIVRKHITVVNSLIAAGADINARDKDQNTPLHLAAWSGNTAVVNSLIAAGADINARNKDQKTPLHFPAQEAHIILVNSLIAASADINARDKDQQTPLHLAVRKGYVNVVNSLIAAGADINAQNKNQNTPLHLAAWLAYKDIVNSLIAAGAKLNTQNKNQKTPLRLLLKTLESYLNESDEFKSEVVSPILLLIFEKLHQLNAHTWQAREQQKLLDYLIKFESQTNQSLLTHLKRARKQFYDTVREKYKCPKASDRVIAYFLDRQQALRARTVIILLDFTHPKQNSRLSSLPLELRLLILKIYIQLEEDLGLMSFSSEEQTDYKVLVQSFCEKEALSLQAASDPSETIETSRQTLVIR